MKKISLKVLLCILLCFSLSISLLGCGEYFDIDGIISAVNEGIDFSEAEPYLCTLCPDKENCCSCYRRHKCVCNTRPGGNNSVTNNAQQSSNNSSSSYDYNSYNSYSNNNSINYGGTTVVEKYDPVKSLAGRTIVIMRSWEPYESGKNTAHDNWIKRVAELEKKYNCNIVERKWSVTLDQEAMAGVRPSGHLYQVNGDWVANYAKSYFIAPWDDAMKATGIDMTSDVYFKNSVQLNNYNGKQWAIGVEEGKMMSTLVYNKKLTSAVGADIEKLMDEGKWTWSAMTDIAKKVKAKYPNKWGIGLDAHLAVYGMVASNGSKLVSVASEGTIGSNLKDKRVVEALTQMYNWINVDKVATLKPRNAAYDYQLNELMKNNIAFTFNEAYCFDLLNEGMNGNDYGIAYLPMGPSVNQYYVCMESSWPFVMPRTYADQGADLLFIVDALYQFPAGYSSKDQVFEDLYIRRFSNANTYNRVKKMHREIKSAPIIEIELGESYNWLNGMYNLFENKTTVASYVQSYHEYYDRYMRTNWNDIKFTGKLG